MVDAITGKTAKRQAALAEAAQRSQEQRIKDDEAKVAAVEDGQRRVRMGGRGLLAFIDDKLPATFGGAAASGGTAGAGEVRF